MLYPFFFSHSYLASLYYNIHNFLHKQVTQTKYYDPLTPEMVYLLSFIYLSAQNTQFNIIYSVHTEYMVYIFLMFFYYYLESCLEILHFEG